MDKPEIPHLLTPQFTQSRGGVKDYVMTGEWLTPWDFKEEIDAGIIGVPFHQGGFYVVGGQFSTDAFRDSFAGFATRSSDFGVDISDVKLRDIGDVQMHPTNVHTSYSNIEESLTDLYRYNPRFFPFVIGGDHAIAAPSVRAWKKAQGWKVGLIDFDAHNDLRDPSFHGPGTGTPFRQLLDQGYIDGNNAVQIGLHGFLASSILINYGKAHGFTMVSAREVGRDGIQRVVEDALRVASDGTDAIYISFDLDTIEAALAPGCGAHTPGGLMLREVFEALFMLGEHPKVKAMDIVELDPLRDMKNFTSRIASSMVLTMLAGMKGRDKDS